MSTIIDEQVQSPPTTPVTAGFIVTVLYLIIEYGRPQDHVALIGAMRPNLILMLLLVILLFNNWSRLQMAASAQSSRMLVMLFLLALHVPFAVNNGRAFHEAQSFLMYVVMFASIIVFVDTYDKLRLFLKCWIYLMIYVAINGIVGGGSAGSSFLQDNNDFALLMNAMLPFGVFLFLYEHQKKTKLLYLTASALVVASIVVTVSRGGFVGLVTVMFVIWLTSSRKLVSLILACLLALGIYLFADPVYWERISTIKTAQDYNAASRLELWKAAWEMFKDHPFGVGAGNYPVHLPEYQSEFFGDKNMWGKAAHSVWFTLLAELGIPGVVLYLSLLRANVRDLRYLKNLPPDDDIRRFAHFLALAFMASLAGFFASGTFLSALYYPHYWFLTGMIVATKKVIDRAVASGVVDPDRQVEFGKA